ncbi:uncharacterized protein TRIADDRAFT_26822 [Trichoplax adhaerens]|uniref:Acetoacetyl-CoA synthetase n=1 Tax=Trichoplax adhaerens TaxID=10228 RepID=B3RZ05_TRIAD|nr:hypothetical protein TRIADDRAFT_26822 [Trichoplax adhaerens]EDV23760.1 hypothetical protein TRIADDRAFT_26822 [Trichoplax adhaerens]|eukprot:XP_002113286.1 hypothetical protein TRIADDRAFT_26822 [Trichoplax adhaerens]
MSQQNGGYSKLMWSPNPDVVTNMDQFRHAANEKFHLQLSNYQELYEWSVTEYADFWGLFYHFSDIVHSQPYTQVVDKSKRVDEIPEWFHGTRLNFAENLLKYRDDKVAIYFTGEGRELTQMTYQELYHQVRQYAAALRKSGVQNGDRVVGYIPNCPQAIIAMLATASIGAIWSSTAPDFGTSGVLDRFKQISPKIIFSVDGVTYNAKQHTNLDKLKTVVNGLATLEKVIVIPYINEIDGATTKSIRNCILLDDFLKTGLDDDDTLPELVFEQVPFNHPLFIMYSSGTTGIPKCMVHSVGGTLIQLLKEHILHGDMRRDDVMLFYTTTGWMMWNWLVAVLGTGAGIVLYDGSPFVPRKTILWDLIDEIGVSFLGAGAKWYLVSEDNDIYPMKSHKLEKLRFIASTGSKLMPRSYEYIYNHVKKDVILASITGGTDIISCFAGHNPSVPVHLGEIQARNLGMAVESYSEVGKPVFGQNGELVCVKPFPCQPIYFWNDEDGSKYQKAYFSHFEGVWHHGDYCTIIPSTGGIIMHGRSDATLNPNGVRFGSAEIYRVVSKIPEVADSLCIGQPIPDGERVILFLKIREGERFTGDLIKAVKGKIRSELSARHLPAIILQTPDIPYTLSGKKVEVAVKKIICGEEVSYRNALQNPTSLDFYQNLPELSV